MAGDNPHKNPEDVYPRSYSVLHCYPDALVYTITARDTLKEIAVKFNTTIEQILQLNQGLDQNGLVAGHQICIPAQEPEKCASPVNRIAKKVSPSIVGIKTTVRNPQGQFSEKEGSGIIIKKEGYIVTNHHLVEEVSSSSKYAALEVFLPDKRKTKAKLIGGDKLYDLAVIKVDLEKLPVAELGDSSKIVIGELAVAVGNPKGLETLGSISAGVFSGLNRQRIFQESLLTYIQTDAAINRGNSGGALVNHEGQVIGINVWGVPMEVGYENMSLAIPINTAKPIIDQLIELGMVKDRLRIGITGKEINEALIQSKKLPMGVFIEDIAPKSSAKKAGMRKGDILISLADKPVISMKDLDDIKKGYKAGDVVNVVVVRKDKIHNLKITFFRNINASADV